MNDREKQIEEMAKIIKPVLENRVDIGFIPDLAKPIAKELLNHYQPKLPEGLVVISKEEYERFQKMENTLKRISTVSPTEAESENKALKETIGIVLAQKRNIWNSYNQLKEEIDYKVDQARKQAVKEACEEIVKYGYVDTNGDLVVPIAMVEIVERKYNKIAKEFGVEL